VQIRTHDGVVRTMFKVRHIPDMTHNLISLGTIKPNGCKYSAKNVVLKVMKGAMVLMKGFKWGSLYYLQGTSVTGLAAVCTASARC